LATGALSPLEFNRFIRFSRLTYLYIFLKRRVIGNGAA